MSDDIRPNDGWKVYSYSIEESPNNFTIGTTFAVAANLVMFMLQKKYPRAVAIRVWEDEGEELEKFFKL